MIKKMLLIILAAEFFSATGQLVLADSMYTHSEATQAVQGTENAGNKICPVTGEEIDEKYKATYEYKGKIYNFCCENCVEVFKKDPQKYIKKTEEEKQLDKLDN